MNAHVQKQQHTSSLDHDRNNGCPINQQLRNELLDAVQVLSEIWPDDEQSFWDTFGYENRSMCKLQYTLRNELEKAESSRDILQHDFYPLSLDAIERIHVYLGNHQLEQLRRLQKCQDHLPRIQACLEQFGQVAFLVMIFESEIQMLPIQSIIFDEDREEEGKTPYVDCHGKAFTGLGMDVARGGGDNVFVTLYIRGAEISREPDEEEPIPFKGLLFQNGSCKAAPGVVACEKVLKEWLDPSSKIPPWPLWMTNRNNNSNEQQQDMDASTALQWWRFHRQHPRGIRPNAA